TAAQNSKEPREAREADEKPANRRAAEPGEHEREHEPTVARRNRPSERPERTRRTLDELKDMMAPDPSQLPAPAPPPPPGPKPGPSAEAPPPSSAPANP